ncbi:hypothetical protein MMYC01_201947 [Madurella mycetomatis]|uniref:Infection structure specific protein n=1 Tax=Madurella mycetomatis TaxID=100816 RepID=A0A175WCQ6_9PEZI|nr:hypothetical protein MMYC01_201947 [Madurella mycetomatis]
MHTSQLLALLVALPLAVANPAPFRPIITPRPLPPHANNAAVRHINVRQEDQLSPEECEESYISLADTFPTETGELAEWFSTAQPPVEFTEPSFDICTTTAISPPASLSSAYSVLSEQQVSWFSSIAPVATSMAGVCDGEISIFYEFLAVSDEESCTEVVSNWLELMAEATTTTDGTGAPNTSITATNTNSSPPPTDDASEDNSPPETSSSTGGVAGPRETGFVAAAAAAAAVAGAVAAL